MRVLLLLLALWLSKCRAGLVWYAWDAPVGAACNNYLAAFNFGDCFYAEHYYGCMYADQPFLGTILHCADEYSRSKAERTESLEYLEYMAAYGGFVYSTEDLKRFLANATDYLRPAADAYNLTIVDFPIEPDHEEMLANRHTIDQIKQFVKIDTKWLGWGMVWFWAIVVLCFSVFNLGKRYLGLQLPRALSQFLRKHLLYASTFRKILPGFFPTRIHSVLICVFMIQVVLSSCLGYNFTLPNPYLRNDLFILYMIQHRTGMFALYMYPLLTLFGVRNNPLTKVSGISFAEFLSYHKVFGIIMVIQASIHGLAWSIYAARQGLLISYGEDAYWRWGIVATCAAGVMCAHSLRLIRDYAYEFFLLLHNILGIFVIVGTWLHLNTLGYRGFIWGMLGIWCVDRVLRIVRIALSGGFQKIEIEMCDSDVFKITLKKPRFYRYYPGSYAFVSFVRPWYFMWQFHPFTAVSSPVEGENTIAFYVKAKKGLTRSLSRLKFDDRGKITMRAIVEGPYGSPTHACAPTTRLVGLTTGLGISGVVPVLFEHVRSQKLTKYLLKEAPTTERSKDSSEETSLLSREPSSCELYWVVHDARYVKWMHMTLDYLAQNGCRVVVLVTKDGDVLERNTHYTVRLVGGRPDMAEIVSQTVQDCETRSQDVCFCSCGSDSFNTTVRDAIAENMTIGSKIDVEHNSEAHTW